MPESAYVVRHLTIHGRVQGVAYRASAQSEAERLGLHGWVRNRADGCVEALVAGAPTAVERFVEWAHRGPSHARVDRIETRSGVRPEYAGFVTLPTL